MNRKILYFINPISGPRRKISLHEIIAKKTLEKNIPFEIIFTTVNEDYEDLPGKIKKEKITDIVICGGDGTVNRVAASVLDLDVNIGIIPAGSGNGLALTAKIPRQIDKALEVVFNGKTNYIDGFFINEKFSCMLCGIGFDAQVAHDFALQKERGLSTYIKETFKNFITSSTWPFDITIKGKTFSVNAFFVSIANGNQFGNNVTIAPKASLNDGLLDIIIVKKMSKARLVWAVLKQINAGEVRKNTERNFHKKDVLYFQADKINISNPSMAPLHIDGEPSETNKKFVIEILPSALRLLQP
ncbi:MAG: diacylglycerol kinase family lipid kinase [Chitinophagaceae bacterium]|nr:diacylglycerol kinase family lipid kinase [Chitinophagaceae bacterium]